MNLQEKPFYLSDGQVAWVEEALKRLTPKQKIGQLFCIMGQDYGPEETARLVSEYGVGGILYRPAPAQTIRDWFAPLDPIAPVPLLKAANLEEGGSGGISDGTFFGWPMLTAATGDTSFAQKFAEVCAKEGQTAGINWTFSPVCDIDYNFMNPITNVRTSGSDPDKVLSFVRAYVKTVQDCGMAACAKHFPGDGVDFRDHHLHPSYNSLSAKDWYDSYGKIYKSLIDEGLISIMVGHIVQPNVEMDINPNLKFEDCLPGSTSPELLQGVLRKKYGFNGLITTDATIMGGFCQAMERKNAVPAAIMAGCDMLVFSTDIYEDMGYMAQALADGRLSEERLNAALRRILALKAKVGFRGVDLAGCPQAKLWQAECADKAVTLVKSKRDLLPISPKKYKTVRLVTLGNDSVAAGSMTGTIQGLLEQAGFTVERYDPMADDLHGTANLRADRLTLMLANVETASNQTDVRIHWCKKHALDMPRFVHEEDCIFVSFANPYHLQDVPRVPVYINVYSCNAATMRAVVEKLMGRSEFQGISPVDAYCGLMDTRL
ncbi:MAG: glycosyl hydrolase family 3 [Firmicutes bacterium]|nr:glycosyl hydrolase family 3 [Bacillota bacterium]